MSDPYLSEIRLMSFTYAPKGWAQCNGQLLPINQNQALFSLLGTTFGGNGQTSFALPDLRNRVPIHVGAGHVLGERGGEDVHTLAVAELPQHRHALNASTLAANSPVPTGNVLAATDGSQFYGPPSDLAAMQSGSVSNTGGAQPHPNLQPFLTLNFCIALVGIYPSRD